MPWNSKPNSGYMAAAPSGAMNAARKLCHCVVHWTGVLTSIAPAGLPLVPVGRNRTRGEPIRPEQSRSYENAYSIPGSTGTAAFGKGASALSPSFQTLRGVGLPVPDTCRRLTDARSGLRSGRFHFPLVVKPRTGFGSANIFLDHDETQLEAFFSYAPGMLIQEFVAGDL